MKISEILKQNGIFSNDIRQRFKNKQIKLNGEIVSNIDLDIELIPSKNDDSVDVAKTVVAGDFISNIIKNDTTIFSKLQIFDFETLSDSNINSELKSMFDNFLILRFSKVDVLFLTKMQ